MNYNDAEIYFSKTKTYLKKMIGISSQTQELDHTERRKEFIRLSSEDKKKLVQPQLDIFMSATTRKFEILPVMATLAATLIVVATLNSNLVPLNILESKGILSLFLILIPITLHFYIKNNEKTASNAIAIIESYQLENIFNELKRTTFLRQLSTDFPAIVVYLFYAVITLIIFRVWFG